MTKQEKIYKRLPGKKKGLIGIYTLWQGPDHLLAIDSKRFSEDYKRFYYNDIQAIITRRTSRGKIYNLILGVFCVFFVLLALPSRGGGAVFFMVMAGLFLLALLVNLFLGPTCVCHLQTAVRFERLPSLNRLKNAYKAVKILKPLIEKAQGSLTPEALETYFLGNSLKRSVGPRERDASSGRRHEHGNFHKALAILLLVYGVIIFIDMFINNPGVSLIMSGVGMAAVVVMIIALVRQQGSDIYNALKSTTWATLALMIMEMVLGYVIAMTVVFKNPVIANNQWEMIKAISEISPFDSSWHLGIYIFSICASFLLGIAGLVLVSRFQKEYAQLNVQPGTE
ncbi:MAG: hypothetical protein KAR13_12035 [Desulfobulbaceae bacterium]|nr:hypothetical protein [Desulfobulbaceae bacterium]